MDSTNGVLEHNGAAINGSNEQPIPEQHTNEEVFNSDFLLNMPRDEQFVNAKAFLKKTSLKSGQCLYDHLSELLTRIIIERPESVYDSFEEISKVAKRDKFQSEKDTILDKKSKTAEVALADIQKRLFERSEAEEEFTAEQEMESPLPNLSEYMFYFEQAGVGLNHEETYRIWLALKRLVDTSQFQHVRFWGKVFGIEQNYFIAEAELSNREEEEEDAEEEEEEKPEEEEPEPAEEGEEDGDPLPPEPKPTWKPPPEVPKEEKGTGCNRKTYFVCNEPGKPWIRLPSVTPKQIQVARKIRKFFTGRLDAPVISYPPFPGTEMNYLRAQIARISAGTHISPQEFYVPEAEEEEEDGEVNENFVENADYEPHSVRELAQLPGWAHHVLYILNQGRTKWWDPNQRADDEEFEDEEEEEKDADAPQREEGVRLFSTLDEDKAIDNTLPWTVKISSDVIPQHAICMLKSNLWPGAYTFGKGRLFENVYIGWGHKYSVNNFNPAQMGPIQEEFPSGPDITEIDDPTPEEEAQAQRARAEAEGEEEMEEEGEEEDEEED